MKAHFLSFIFQTVLLAALFQVNGSLSGLEGADCEMTVFQRSFSTKPGPLELPDNEVPSLEEQLQLYRELYFPYAASIGDEQQFPISGFKDFIDIAFSYAWKHMQEKGDFKKPVLEILYAQALEDDAQNRMTQAAFKQHMLRLGVVLSVHAKAPFKNQNIEFFNEKSSAIYFRNPDQIDPVSWMPEAILFIEHGQIDYGIFVEALADETIPLVLSALSTEAPFGNSAGFLRHDYGHNYRTAAYANIPAIRTIIHTIRSAKPELDPKDHVLLFYMFHELMLRTDQSITLTPDEAFHAWHASTRKRIVHTFCEQIADDVRLRGLLLPDSIDNGGFYRSVYEVISKDAFQMTLFGKNQPFKRFIKGQIAITSPGQYRLNVDEVGPKLMQEPGFMEAFKAEHHFDGPSPLTIYSGKTENKMFKERAEDLTYIYGREAIAELASKDDFSLLLLFLQTFDSFYNEHQHLFRSS